MINEVCINTYGTHKYFRAKMILLKLFSRVGLKSITSLQNLISKDNQIAEKTLDITVSCIRYKEMTSRDRAQDLFMFYCSKFIEKSSLGELLVPTTITTTKIPKLL